MFSYGASTQFFRLKPLFFSLLDDWSSSPSRRKQQSPVAIRSSETSPKKLRPLLFHGYDCPREVLVRNTGSFLEIEFAEEGDAPSVSGGVLDCAEYVLHSVQFHWDSEHTIDGRRYPLEGHLVHYDKNRRSYSEAARYGGVLMLAVVYETTGCKGGPFAALAEAARELRDDRSCDMILEEKFPVSCVLPKYVTSYYYYKGSLTTSPYTEGIGWIVFDVPGRINECYLGKICDIMDDTSQVVGSNARPLQDLNEREVLYVGGFMDKLRKKLRESWGKGDEKG